MNTILSKYANLLVKYCLEIKRGDQLFVQTTTLAEPLVREVYRSAIRAGANVEVNMDFREQTRYIRAPFNLMENQNVDSKKVKIKKTAHAKISKTYFKRTGTRELRRNLCQYPTQAAAQNAGMSLEEYQEFVFGACNLYKRDPQAEWLKVRKYQKKIVQLLNKKNKVRYKGEGIDITFSTKGRTWINSDGQTNMPSGEVYTSPVENSVNGVVNFSYPGVYMGHEVEGVTLWVKDGYIEKWEARRGQAFLNKIFKMKGTRYFGEAAIGTNNNINKFTKNILFDEKIGGTIHMAIGQSYMQAGGKNESPIHWDMIGNMKNGGEIFADDEKIYDSGKFLFV